jgi:hypothetical protein
MKKRTLLLSLLALLMSALAAPASLAAQSAERCFPETGYCISGNIRAYWERGGGLPVFGYPTSPVYTDTIEGSWSGPIQWFERDRLEDHSAQGLGVLAGRLGVHLIELRGQRWQDFTRPSSTPPGCVYFAETQNNLCEPFLSYWRKNGGLERFGYPISLPFTERIGAWSGTVQYFERRRMEHHLEYAGTASEVLLGLLGNEVRGYQPVAGCGIAVLPELEAGLRYTPFLARMGCPSAGASGQSAAFQPFQHGRMIWVGAAIRGWQIWVIRDAGHPAPYPSYGVFADTWDASQPVNGGEQAPDGLYVPYRGFYKVWTGSRGQGQWVGYATTPQEIAANATIQYFDSGVAIRLSSGLFFAFGPQSGDIREDFLQ